MSAGKDRDDDQGYKAEIDRTMAEAEAAVRALEEKELAEEASARGGGDAGGPDLAQTIVDLEAELIAAREDVASTKDKWLRAVADHENYKKRVKRDIDDAVLRSTQALLSSFLPVMDNLGRALEVAEPVAKQATDANSQNLVLGLKMVKDEFLAALGRHGIETVPTVGTAFDPAIHEALQQVDSPDHAPGVVIREFERGYRLGDRLLRPARVVVAGAGSTGKAPGEG